MWCSKSRIGLLAALFLVSSLNNVTSFTTTSRPYSRHLHALAPGTRRTVRMMGSKSSFPEEPSDAQKQQELMFESMSLQGADVIAKMEVPERAKRAMLAEAVEDRIFELTETLEGLVDENGMISEQDREKAVEIARQTKALQIQYNELVSGGPSAILDTL